MELTELVHKGEKKGIFVDKMPASIQRMIHGENVTFVKNRDVYNQEYFKFVKNLVARNSVSKKSLFFQTTLHDSVLFCRQSQLAAFSGTHSSSSKEVS